VLSPIYRSPTPLHPTPCCVGVSVWVGPAGLGSVNNAILGASGQYKLVSINWVGLLTSSRASFSALIRCTLQAAQSLRFQAARSLRLLCGCGMLYPVGLHLP
jgi:hypothetical protein